MYFTTILFITYVRNKYKNKNNNVVLTEQKTIRWIAQCQTQVNLIYSQY